jgi:3-deoxy-D-manno-octulosonate 8-phosphate phosphatase (KDO 8-P phosphatase)
MTSEPKNISVLALDVDGVLTDGTISFDSVTNKEIKKFNVHDGLGISLWQKAGNAVVIISGRNAQCVETRAKELKISHVYQGSSDKIEDLNHALKEIGATSEETCFVGDDLGDILVMQHCKYSIAVGDAAQEVKDVANHTTALHGGKGAVRESVEHLMRLTGTWAAAVESCKAEPAKQ